MPPPCGRTFARNQTDRSLRFRLARELGMTVGELEQRVSTCELHDWGLYLDVEETAREQAQENARRRKGR